jgi:hypothetical protein
MASVAELKKGEKSALSGLCDAKNRQKDGKGISRTARSVLHRRTDYISVPGLSSGWKNVNNSKKIPYLQLKSQQQR